MLPSTYLIMRLTIGTQLGPYWITKLIGSGGMGEVYQARDSRLDRSVAIKIFNENVKEDLELRERFRREAKSLSMMQHPNICTLLDIGEQDGIEFLVMEHLEGDTLAARLSRGPLSVTEITRISIQIADALDQAHRHGIVHRDLKPGNVMLTPSGVKLLDFGLAKHAAPYSHHAHAQTRNSGVMLSPSAPLTEKGFVVGTVEYMSPEQLRGQDLDARSDIFSFGTVLYEMCTGERPFTANSLAMLKTAILVTDPIYVQEKRPDLPLTLANIVTVCLEKDPADRWQSAGDIKRMLKELQPTRGSGLSLPVRLMKASKVVTVALLLVFVLVVIVGMLLSNKWLSDNSGLQLHAAVLAPAKHMFLFYGDVSAPPALSPDGRTLAFAMLDDDYRTRLWLRDMRTGEQKVVESGDRATFPFWSPDSKNLAFFQAGKLKYIPRDGGSPVVVTDAFAPRGGAWLKDGSFLYVMDTREPIMRYVSGQTPKPVTKLVGGYTTHRWPIGLPDGKHFLYFAAAHQMDSSNPVPAGIRWASLDGTEDHFIVASNAQAAFAAGRMLYLRNQSLVAQSFNPEKGVFTGDAVVLADTVMSDPSVWHACFDVAGSEMLIYQSGGVYGTVTLSWFDRTGKLLSKFELKNGINSAGITSDGAHLAAESDPNNAMWIYDIVHNSSRQLTLDLSADRNPLWTHDQQNIVYTTDIVSGDQLEVRRRRADGTGDIEKIMQVSRLWLHSMTPDDRYVAATAVTGSGRHVEILDLKERKVLRKIEGPYRIFFPAFSPDGKWLAVVANQTGHSELYLTSALEEQPLRQMTSQQDVERAMWTRDGHEICFISKQNTSCADVVLKKGNLELGEPKVLFRTPQKEPTHSFWFPVNNGKDFVISTINEDTQHPVEVVTNWAQFKK